MVSGISGSGMDASAMWQRLLQKADANGDGKISKTEFESAKPKDGTGPGVEDIFSKIDTNGDGTITEDENAVFISSMQAPPPPPSPEEMFTKADTDGDGKLSKAEFSAMAPKGGSSPSQETDTDTVFDEMDTNQDGFVSQAEFTAAMDKMMQKMQSQAGQDQSANLA
jgi:hypothetical protein